MASIRRGLATVTSLNKAGKIVCIGRNYADHISELSSARPKQPFFFLKPPSCMLLPGQGPVVRPRGVDLHHEVELAVIMGRRVRSLDAADDEAALDAIESYALAIDMTARNVQDEAKRKGLPWDMAKGFDTFLPVSRLVRKSAVPDPHAVELYLDVNGHTRQRDSTALMLFRLPRLLSDIAKVMTLEPGDMVLTGTPKGVGPVVPGDVIRAGIRVDGIELDDARIDVAVEESTREYVYAET